MNTDKITEIIIGSAYAVSNALGVGFLEKVYENSLFLELQKQGLEVIQQKALSVFYDGHIVGEYYADLVVEDIVIVELKASENIAPIHQTQLLNYLKATGLQTGLILNFGTSRLGIKRMKFGFKAS